MHVAKQPRLVSDEGIVVQGDDAAQVCVAAYPRMASHKDSTLKHRVATNSGLVTKARSSGYSCIAFDDRLILKAGLVLNGRAVQDRSAFRNEHGRCDTGGQRYQAATVRVLDTDLTVAQVELGTAVTGSECSLDNSVTESNGAGSISVSVIDMVDPLLVS
jgi:hypothetical protein